MLSVSRCAFRSSAKTPAPQHTLLQTRDTMSARARTAAGSRERGRPRAVPGVLCENHLRVVSMCACSKKEGSVLLATPQHCTVRLVASLNAGSAELEPSPAPSASTMRPAAALLQGSAGLSSPAPSPAAAGSSPAGSATAAITMSSCTTTCSPTVAIVSCIGCPASPPRWWLRPQIFGTAVHGVDELTETLSPFSASGRPPNTTCPDTWPWEQKTCRLRLLRHSSITLRSRTNEKRGERALHGQRIALLQTIGHCEITINLRKPTEETQAMTILY